MKRSLRSWLWRVSIDQEVDEELALHVEMRLTAWLEERRSDIRDLNMKSSKFRVPGSGFVCWFRFSGSEFQVPGSKFGEQGTLNFEPGTRTGTSTRTGNLEPGTWNGSASE